MQSRRRDVGSVTECARKTRRISEAQRRSNVPYRQGDVANAFGRDPIQRSHGRVRPGAKVEEAQIIDRVTGQRCIEPVLQCSSVRR